MTVYYKHAKQFRYDIMATPNTEIFQVHNSLLDDLLLYMELLCVVMFHHHHTTVICH